MKDGPDISKTAAMMGDPARANMLMALMSGMSLTSNELAREAGVTPSTASVHLARLEETGLLKSTKQGRFRYFRIADSDVAHAIEALVTVAARAGHVRTRPGPKDAAMREARSCYDHLAGRVAVALFDHWIAADVLTRNGESVELTARGREFLSERGLDIEGLEGRRRPVCRTCIDWSERRNHLGGGLGAAVLAFGQAQGWLMREAGTRVVRFSGPGLREFENWYAAPGRQSAA